MVLNVACILAQWHEASSLCKGLGKKEKSTAGLVPRGAVLLYRALVTRFMALLAGREIISNSPLGRCTGCWVCTDFAGVSGSQR